MIQKIKKNDCQAHIKNAGKEVMKVMSIQMNLIFTKGMSEASFIELVYTGINKEKRTKEGVEFFHQLYRHLSKGHTVLDIEKEETGETTLALYNKAWSIYSTATSKTTINDCALEAVISNGTTTSAKLLCPWWLIVLLALLALLMKGDSEHHENNQNK